MFAFLLAALLPALGVQDPRPQVAPPTPAAQAPAPPQQEPPPQGAALDKTTVAALERLATLLAEKDDEIARARTSDPTRLPALETERRELGWQFGGLASRLDVQEFEAPQQRQFDLQKEVEQLVKPLIQTIKDVTAEPRQVAEMKGRLELLTQRQKLVEAAMHAVEATRDQLPAGSAARKEAQRELDVRWRPALEAIRGESLVLDARLLARQQGQKSMFERLTESARNFVQNSGLNLALCALVFVGVLFSLRWLQNRLLRERAPDRRFSLRLLEVVLAAATFLLATLAALVVPYMRDDWLLLAIGIVFLLGVGWVVVRMLPQFFEQVRLVLNVGAVREGERLEVDGLPYRVDHLRFYSRLHNPELQGGLLRVPIQDLIGKRSRRAGPDEPWFPSRAGDWVQLADGTLGPVLAQSPSSVVVAHLGAPRTYPTAAYLAQNPRNLSRGFVVDTTFGIDYRHQKEATTVVPELLRAAVERGLRELVPAEQLRRVTVQFDNSAASSLDFVVAAEFTGDAAPRFPELRRALQRFSLDAATAHGWSVPYPQIVVHRGGEG